jgi:hypothetical protein
MFAAKKHVQTSDLYDIAANKKFVDGVSAKTGRQMRQTLLANLHLFSQKQQRFLQSEASTFDIFNPARNSRGGDGEASDSGGSLSPARDEPRRGNSNSPSRVARSSRASRLAELLAGNDEDPLRPPPMLTAKGYVSRYPYPLPDIVPGEDVRKYAFGTADDFLAVGDDGRLAICQVRLDGSRSRSRRRVLS